MITGDVHAGKNGLHVWLVEAKNYRTIERHAIYESEVTLPEFRAERY